MLVVRRRRRALDARAAVRPDLDHQRGPRATSTQWRSLPNPSQWQVTPETARLLQHWRHHEFSDLRPFFCQIEAVETAIWLTEVAPQLGKRGKRFLEHLRAPTTTPTPSSMRLALKLATGAGKTTVMAMLIAWQTSTPSAARSSKHFTRGFLVVTPGITIKDRLRVLQPNDPDSYYASRELVPPTCSTDIEKAKIVITNYHAFKLPRADRALQGRPRAAPGPRRRARHARDRRTDAPARHARPDGHEEHPRPQRRGAPLLPREARTPTTRTTSRATSRKEAEKNNEAARLWISGLEAVNRKLGVCARHRPLRDAVLPARLRLRRGHALPLDDQRLLADGRHRVRHRQAAARAGRRQHPRRRDADVPQPLGAHRQEDAEEGARQGRRARPARACRPQLQTALEALYGHYEKTFELWQEAGIRVPPVLHRRLQQHRRPRSSSTTTSPASSATNEDGSTTFENGRLALFRNFDEHGNPLAAPEHAADRQRAARIRRGARRQLPRRWPADEIERFRREIVERDGRPAAQAENITDQDLLREVMNTVGKHGQLGEPIRCVVSVSMLTEGWDANTVTHILGVRAFGTQLLCEQVVGRALRRQSYELNDEGLFNVEYADILGIPFDFTAKPVVAPPQPPRETAIRRCRWAPLVRLVLLALDQNDQLTQVARRLGQPSLAEAREDAALKVRDGGPDMASGQLDLISGRARTCHVMTVGARTATTAQDALSCTRLVQFSAGGRLRCRDANRNRTDSSMPGIRARIARASKRPAAQGDLRSIGRGRLHLFASTDRSTTLRSRRARRLLMANNRNQASAHRLTAAASRRDEPGRT